MYGFCYKISSTTLVDAGLEKVIIFFLLLVAVIISEKNRRKIAGWTILLTCVGALVLTSAASSVCLPR